MEKRIGRARFKSKSQQARLITEFIDYFCATHSIPADFYRAFAAVELAQDAPRPVSR